MMERKNYRQQPQGLAEGDTCNITVTGGQTEAGTYTAQAAAIDNANYKLPAEQPLLLSFGKQILN